MLCPSCKTPAPYTFNEIPYCPDPRCELLAGPGDCASTLNVLWIYKSWRVSEARDRMLRDQSLALAGRQDPPDGDARGNRVGIPGRC